jgi:uncharacterized protein
VHFRPIEPRDYAEAIRINQLDVDKLAPMDADRLGLLASMSVHAHVVDIDGAVAGFVITMPPGSSYDSDNYAWFSERYTDFLYLDRIVVSDQFRRRGVASFIYDHVEAGAAERGGIMLLEVNIEPANPPSLLFHANRQYEEVGRLEHDSGKKITSMLSKDCRGL